MGWWKDNELTGNCRKFRKDGKIEEEGWFEEGEWAADFDHDLTLKHKVWDMKPEYFLEAEDY